MIGKTAALLLALVAGCYSTFEEQKAGPVSPKPKAHQPAKKAQKAKKAKKKPQQSYTEAWRLICHAERLSGAQSLSGKARESAVTSWIVEHLKNKEARYWFIGLGQLKREHRLQRFLAEARKAGFATCPCAPILFPKRQPEPDAGAGAG